MSVFWKNLNGAILSRMDVHYIETKIYKKGKKNGIIVVLKPPKENQKFNFFFTFVRNGASVSNNVQVK